MANLHKKGDKVPKKAESRQACVHSLYFIIPDSFAGLGTSFTNFGASLADGFLKFRIARHEVGACLTDLNTVHYHT